jgi:16S rRNA (adenine1518-N6/adenine1519-N6)-dimethyltransferase
MTRLGQHFMVDKKVLQRIVDYARLDTDDRVLEIGPGGGFLTELLAEKANVVAIEKDKIFYGKLQASYPHVDFIHGDALKVKWPGFDKCVSNLPYRISKKFFLKLIQGDFKLAVIVVQKEFAEKLVAKTGSRNYGFISVAVQLFCDIELLDIIPKNAFKPQPKVQSQVVRLTQKKKADNHFLIFLAKLFQRRNRKMGEKRVKDLSPEEFMAIFEKS